MLVGLSERHRPSAYDAAARVTWTAITNGRVSGNRAVRDDKRARFSTAEFDSTAITFRGIFGNGAASDHDINRPVTRGNATTTFFG